MSVATCALCGAGFSARSDAIYCSSACRQKAHRARTAHRIADLSRRLLPSSGPVPTKPDVVASAQRARAVMDRSGELCQRAAEHVQQAAAIYQRSRENLQATAIDAVPLRAPGAGESAAALPTPFTKRVPWRGN